jgi:hypothetical protein
MTPTCPCCGSVAVVRNGRMAACMNPRCADNGTLKRVQVFRQVIVHVAPDPRKVALASGGSRILPVLYES